MDHSRKITYIPNYLTDTLFVELCKDQVYNYVKDTFFNGEDVENFTVDNVYVVWQVKVLQNWKALLSTTISDGMYYEITVNGDSDQLYLDAYKKQTNKTVDLVEYYKSKGKIFQYSSETLKNGNKQITRMLIDDTNEEQ